MACGNFCSKSPVSPETIKLFYITRINYVVTEQRPTGLAGLQTAVDHITRGDIEKIIGGICDVGCPPIFGESDKVPPGAVFLMLEKSPAKERSSYGKLQLNSSGDLLLDGSKIEDLSGLVQKCITSYQYF